MPLEYISSLFHRIRSIGVLAIVLCSQAGAQSGTPVGIYTFDGSQPGERLGWTVAGPGDLNSDGVPDFLAGGPGDFISGSTPGIVRVYSGRDGSVLYTVAGLQNADGFGLALAVLSDVDGDAVADFAVGAPYSDANGLDSGSAFVFSGASGSLINVSHGSAAGDAYGWSVSDGRDFNGDVGPDIAVGAPLADGPASDCGRVYVVDSITSANLTSISGTHASGQFGYSVAAVRDSAHVSIYIGEPGVFNTAGGSGVIAEWVDNAATTAQAFPLPSQWVGSLQIGLSVTGFHYQNTGARSFACLALSGISNVSDTVFDLVRLTPQSQFYVNCGSLTAHGDGHVAVFESPGVVQFFMPFHAPFTSQMPLGERVDKDPNCNIMGMQSFSTSAGLTRGWSIAVAGQINQDAIVDFLVGDPFVATAGLDRGRVAVFLNQQSLTPPLNYCTAKTNSLACVPHLGFEGAPSLSVGDNFRVVAGSVLNNKPGVLLWAINPNAIPFGGGTLCLGPLLHRVPFPSSGGNPPPLDCSGSYSFHFSHAFLSAQGMLPGQVLYSQVYSRDPGFVAPASIGLTEGVRFTVLP